MKALPLLCFLLLVVFVPVVTHAQKSKPIRVLIVDGFSNHDWKQTTFLIKSILEETGQFKVEVSTTPTTANDTNWKNWQPHFKNYEVVIQNTNNIQDKSIRWPAEIEKELADYVRSGGGLYIFHSANNAFPHWPEYDRMIGLGWRSKETGYAIEINNEGKLVRIPPGEGKSTFHGPRFDYIIHILTNHPINKGFPRQWKIPNSELYIYPRGSAENLTVLSYAFDSATNKNWPVEWIVQYGKGRVYNSSMGHLWKNDTYPVGFRSIGFQTTLIRATEWLASGKVTYPVPGNFPSANAVNMREETDMPGQRDKKIVFYDNFNGLTGGDLFPSVGAHTEYHYLKEAAPRGNWALSTFRYGTQNTWSVFKDGDDKVIFQKKKYEDSMEYHHMIVTGDELWKDYNLEVKFAPMDTDLQSGVIFRYRNDRCYYFFGVKKNKAILKMVKHGVGFHKAYEKILAEAAFEYTPGAYLTASIAVNGNNIQASFRNGPSLKATDSTFPKGKIALTADVPSKFSYAKLSMNEVAEQAFVKERAAKNKIEKDLQAANPTMVLWKKINIKGFGVGRNLRFGDMDGDGQTDVLIGQVLHHGPADSHSELSCLTAMTFDGKRLWQIGKPDLWKDHLTNDVAFQIHDIDNDGKKEVVYTMHYEIIVADAATGKTKYKAPTPVIPATGTGNASERILGDCIYFCDLEGKGYDGNIIIKDRYKNLWALNSKLETLWTYACNTGHYPFACDIDKDGKDELMIGYSLFNHDGKRRWTVENTIADHADGVAIVDYKNNGELRLMCAASDEGMFFTNMKGDIIKHHFIGHVQNPVVGNFRDDLPGLETISINFWGNQGIVHFFDAEGNIYHDFEPNQYGSMMMPLNWTGRSEEFFIHNPNVEEGGIYDGWGRKVVVFPEDGHPDMCNASVDLTGDARDEIIVWNPEEIWVYTQSDNPKTGKLYKPQRNPLYNYSNYQVTVSLPGWSQ